MREINKWFYKIVENKKTTLLVGGQNTSTDIESDRKIQQLWNVSLKRIIRNILSWHWWFDSCILECWTLEHCNHK